LLALKTSPSAAERSECDSDACTGALRVAVATYSGFAIASKVSGSRYSAARYARRMLCERRDVYGIWRRGVEGVLWGGVCEVVVEIHAGMREEGIGNVVVVVVVSDDHAEEGNRKGRAPEGEAWLFAGWVMKGVEVMWRYVWGFLMLGHKLVIRALEGYGPAISNILDCNSVRLWRHPLVL